LGANVIPELFKSRPAGRSRQYENLPLDCQGTDNLRELLIEHGRPVRSVAQFSTYSRALYCSGKKDWG
jgi:hypothetical protein